MSRTASCVALVLLLISLSSAQKKARPEFMRKPAQAAIALEVPKTYVAAAQRCDNYAWAAAVEMVLKQKQVNIPQRDWVMKAYGGYKCISPLSTSAYSDLLRYIDGDYALTPERKVRIEAEFAPGAPTAADPFILSFRASEPLILLWNGKPYVWYGLVYDEYVHPNGNKMFEMLELKLLDPLAKTKETQAVSFVKGKDDANQIEGVIRIAVNPR